MTYTQDELITAQLSHALHGYDIDATPPRHRAVLRAADADATRNALLAKVRGRMCRAAKPAFSDTNVTASDVRVLIMARQKQDTRHRYTLRQILDLLITHELLPAGYTVGQIVAAKARAEAVSIPPGVWHKCLCVLHDAGLIEIKGYEDKH